MNPGMLLALLAQIRAGTFVPEILPLAVRWLP